jgi:hypothetical protein
MQLDLHASSAIYCVVSGAASESSLYNVPQSPPHPKALSMSTNAPWCIAVAAGVISMGVGGGEAHDPLFLTPHAHLPPFLEFYQFHLKKEKRALETKESPNLWGPPKLNDTCTPGIWGPLKRVASPKIQYFCEDNT